MRTYNIGIIGYGGFGKFLHHWWDKLEGIKVVAVSDSHHHKEGYGDLKHYGDWRELLLDTSIDIVSIATPPGLHVEIACEAMRSNKHVILEKPIALTPEGAREIIRTRDETGMVITVDHMLRYNPIIMALIQLGKQEAFGKLRHAEVTNYAQDEGLPAQHWFWDKVVSGGIFIEHGVHFFDIVNALTTQKVSSVHGSSHFRNTSQEDQVAATVVYDEGLIASHYHSFSGPGFFEQTTIRLMSDLAKIEIEGWIPMKGRIRAILPPGKRNVLDILPGLQVTDVTTVGNVTDTSRPEGWGSTATDTSNTVHCAGIPYKVDEMVTATFEIRGSKSEVYGACLQGILSDMIKKIENRDHELRVTPENAFEALKVAVAADRSAGNQRE